MENQPSTSLVESTEPVAQSQAKAVHIADLQANPFVSASEVNSGATSLLRAVVTGEMPLDSGIKFGSILGRKIRAMEIELKYGPFMQ